jgi:hypothetical protein
MALRRGDLTAAEADARAVLDAPGRSTPSLSRNWITVAAWLMLQPTDGDA